MDRWVIAKIKRSGTSKVWSLKKKNSKTELARRQKFSSVSHQRVLFNNGGFRLAEIFKCRAAKGAWVEIMLRIAPSVPLVSAPARFDALWMCALAFYRLQFKERAAPSPLARSDCFLIQHKCEFI